MTKIETHRAHVPWSWVTWMTGPWLVLYYIDNVTGGGPLTFTIRKFVENPIAIGLLGSMSVAFTFTVGAAASYMSDRVWTRWGRRRPFLMVGWLGVAVAMMLMPLAPNIGVLVGILILMQVSAAVAKPLEPLYNEVVPPCQRGRAATIRNVAQQLMGLFFFGVLVAQFDSVHSFAAFGRAFEVRGETVLYWCGAVITLAGILFLAFQVREIPPRVPVVRERLGMREFFRDVFGQRQWWMVYLLYITPMLAGTGGGGFGVLMTTEQLGFTKAEHGYAVSIGLVVAIAIFAPVAGYLTDKTSRMRLLRIGIVGPTVVELLYFFYLRYMADYSIPLSALIGFGLAANAFKTCVFLVWGALIFDYIPSNRFGTVSAGLTIFSGLTPFLMINLTGFWVTGFTKIFGSPGAGDYDYSSMYVLQVGCAALALALTFWFQREERKGHVVPLGRLEAALQNN
ncbi:MAG TPA: MFS transporter [Opitutus sp.]|nr:MFS transporter [Opitutus sp.]